MKKLFSIGVLTLVMLTSCQNGSDETMSESNPATKNEINFMGRQLVESDTKEAVKAIKIANGSLTERRQGNIYCSASSGGNHYAYVIVTGDNQPATYWYVVNGNAYQVAYDDLSFNNCHAIAL